MQFEIATAVAGKRSKTRLNSLILAALLVLCLPTDGLATDCIDYWDYIHRVSSAQMPGEVHDVAVAGEHAFVASEIGLHTLDRSDPEQLQILGELPLPAARSLALQGDRAYLVCQGSALHIANIAEPAAPWLEGSLALSGMAWDVAVRGEFAYVAADTAGLRVVDISDPTAPQLRETFNTPGRAFDVALQGDYAYIADRSNLRIIDLVNHHSVSASTADRPDPYMVSVAVNGNYAYTLDTTFGLIVFDVSDPMDPQYVANVYPPGSGKMEVAGSRLYAGAGPGLTIFDVTKPGDPYLLGDVNTSADVSRGLAADGDLVYTAVAYRHLVDVIDASNPHGPNSLGFTYLSGWSNQLALSGRCAYVACRYAGLYVVDIANPNLPVILADFSDLGYAMDVAVAGDYAYVAGGNVGFKVVDISRPEAPWWAGYLELTGTAVSVALQGDRAYIADELGLRVVDIEKPMAPFLLGSIETSGLAGDVAVAGDLAAVADGEELLLVDIADPSAPTVVAALRAWAKVVTLRDGIAYVTGGLGMQVFDVSNPASPTLLSETLLPGYARDLVLVDNIAYLANSNGGLQVVDIADPAAPRSVGSAEIFVFGVAVNEDYVYPINPGRLMVYPRHCDPTATAGGIPPLQEQPAARRMMRQNHPNPGRPATTLAFELPRAARVGIVIFDIGGRRVRELLTPQLRPAGRHEILWDGRGDGGRPLASGVYLARLRAGELTETRKMTLLD